MLVADKEHFKEKWTKFIKRLSDSFKKLLAEERTQFAFIEEVLHAAQLDDFIHQLFEQITKENHKENGKVLTLIFNEIDFFVEIPKDTSDFKLVEIADIILQSLMELFELSFWLKGILEEIHEAKEIFKICSDNKSIETNYIHEIMC